jgi:hypothetical protein
VNFSFIGLSVSSEPILLDIKLNGLNAKLTISENPSLTSVVTYAGMGISSVALFVAILASFLNEKLMGM